MTNLGKFQGCELDFFEIENFISFFLRITENIINQTKELTFYDFFLPSSNHSHLLSYRKSEWLSFIDEKSINTDCYDFSIPKTTFSSWPNPKIHKRFAIPSRAFLFFPECNTNMTRNKLSEKISTVWYEEEMLTRHFFYLLFLALWENFVEDWEEKEEEIKNFSFRLFLLRCCRHIHYIYSGALKDTACTKEKSSSSIHPSWSL